MNQPISVFSQNFIINFYFNFYVTIVSWSWSNETKQNRIINPISNRNTDLSPNNKANINLIDHISNNNLAPIPPEP